MRKWVFFLSFLCLLFHLQAQEQTNSGYDEEFVDLVEYIYGEGYLSQGGKCSTFSQFAGISLEGKKMLDIGCGIGGRDLDLAQEYNLEIVGIDPEDFLIQKAKQYQETVPLQGSVTFQVTKQPLTLSQFSTSSFDILTSRESLLHVPIEKKTSFFQEMYRVLKPAGKLVLVDWMGNPPYSSETEKMIEMDGLAFHMIPLSQYKNWLEQAGFKHIQVLDETPQYITYTQENLNKIQKQKTSFVQKFGEENYTYSSLSWLYQKKALKKREIQVVKIIAEKHP